LRYDIVDFSIQVQALTKRFGDFTAVDNITFDVRKGEIFGFLGANGSGKSTTIRMLTGLLASTSGTASVAGHDINKAPEQVKRRIGYMSQRFSLYEDLTVSENIRFWGGIYGLTDERIAEKQAWAVKTAGLEGREHDLPLSLPGGFKQRLALACAMLHEPEIVFLDEPTGGVDPIMRRRFWELIHELADAGTTVFVTTHYLDEAEYCNRLMLIHAGRLIAGGTPEELKRKYLTNPVFEVEVDRVIEAMNALDNTEGVEETSVFGTMLHVTVASSHNAKELISSALVKSNLHAKRIEPIVPSLEDVFIHLIDKQPEQVEA
jgi:ABC-2 type transport system ATP-binding protein